MPTSPRGLMYKPPLKGEGDQRSWWRGSSVQYNFWGSRIETVRRNSLVPRCPPGACQRRWLPLPVSVMLIFKCFLVQVGNFISYGVCKFICLLSFMYNRFHKELRFFFSLLKRKKKQKKKKVRVSLVLYGNASPEDYTRNCHNRFSSTKLPRRGEQAAAAAVTLPFLQLKLGRRVSGDSPQWEFLHGIRCSPRAGSSGTPPRFPPPAWFPPLS